MFLYHTIYRVARHGGPVYARGVQQDVTRRSPSVARGSTYFREKPPPPVPPPCPPVWPYVSLKRVVSCPRLEPPRLSVPLSLSFLSPLHLPQPFGLLFFPPLAGRALLRESEQKSSPGSGQLNRRHVSRTRGHVYASLLIDMQMFRRRRENSRERVGALSNALRYAAVKRHTRPDAIETDALFDAYRLPRRNQARPLSYAVSVSASPSRQKS